MKPWLKIIRVLILTPITLFNSAYVIGTNPEEIRIHVDKVKKEMGLSVFIDQQQKVYWPIDLPFFIRLATNDSNANDSFLIKDVQLKKLDQPLKSINEGVRLDIPGSQFLRWVNHVSQEETMFRFIADGGAPTTSLKYFGAPRFSNGKTVYFGKGLEVKVQSQDEHSGVKTIFYALDNKNVEEYLNPLKLLKEDSYRFGHQALDNVGYRSRVITDYFTVDTSAPSTAVSYEKNHVATTFSKDTVIKLASLDKLSGVQKIYYKFNNEETFRPYDEEVGISVSPLKSGSQILKYYSVDKVKNREFSKEFNFILDKTPPEVAYTFLGDFYIENDNKYISPTTQISLDATDSLSDVAEVRYRVNDNKTIRYNSVFLPAVDQGPFSLSYLASDILKNTSKEEKVNIIVDKNSPTTSHVFTEPVHKRKDGGVYYVSRKSSLTLKSVDDHSGVSGINVQVNTSSPTLYQEPIKFPNDGRYLVRYWAKDRVNNAERITPILVISDNKAPEIVETFSFDPAGSEKVNNEDIPVYQKNASLGLNARDADAGVSQVEYSMDGKSWTPYSSFLRFPDKGHYKIEVRATDYVGNQSNKTIKFKVVGEEWGTYAH